RRVLFRSYSYPVMSCFTHVHTHTHKTKHTHREKLHSTERCTTPHTHTNRQHHTTTPQHTHTQTHTSPPPTPTRETVRLSFVPETHHPVVGRATDNQLIPIRLHTVQGTVVR